MTRLLPPVAIIAVLGATLSPFAADAPAAAGDACGAGKTLYQAKCSQCHGDNGDGKGVGADFFVPRPRDFTSGAFKIRSTESGELPLDPDLRRVIRQGMPYTGMPAWPGFSEQEVSDLICYVKAYNADFKDTSVHPKTVVVPKAPSFSEASAKAGRAVYEENKCMDCHGKWGRGDGESGPTLKDDWGNPIRPADLTKRWTFRGGSERGDIYRTFMTGLNGTPMPSFASSIKEEDRWKLVDYVYSLSPGSDAGYAGMLSAAPVGKIDSAKLRESLADMPPARFPIVGQVIEGVRDFFPACNAVEARAVYDADRVAVLVSWHDMSAQKTGTNSPLSPKAGDSAAAAPKAAATPIAPAPAAPASPATTAPVPSLAAFSDAIALQIPLQAPAGAVKPYFLFGDRKHPVALRFADLGNGGLRVFIGKGSGKVAPVGSLKGTAGPADARYQDGEWSVAFFLPRKPPAGDGPALETGAFMPIAFSVWDGLSGETGDKRGVTSWFPLYLEPQRPNPAGPAALHAAIALAVGLGGLFAARRWARNS
ncbi:MAG: c-type cytochrome [Fibrobacteres bacterium]|nr:c-type cytochrome [Fibrobacterota bacterium]